MTPETPVIVKRGRNVTKMMSREKPRGLPTSATAGVDHDMLSHPIVRTAAGLVAAGALTALLAPIVLAHGAHASAQHPSVRSALVADRVEDRAMPATAAGADADRAKAAAQQAMNRAAANDKARDAAQEQAEDNEQAEEQAEDNDQAEDMAEAQAIRARIEAAEQAAMAREEAREAQIRSFLTQFQQR